jgi:hypothetical protein
LPDDDQRPIFVLAGGGRTGSTLVQRLLISTRHALIWGEQQGAVISSLRSLLRATDAWRGREARGQFEIFRAQGYNQFIPNMSPDRDAFLFGCRSFLDACFAAPAHALGYARWGFKEIRHGAEDALFLRALFPECALVLLVRHPAACLQSIKSTSWYASGFSSAPDVFLDIWANLSRELAQTASTLPRSILVRYEDLVSDPECVLARLAAVVDIPADAFDREVFDHVKRGTQRPPATLTRQDLDALASPQVGAVAQSLGYDVTA